MERTRELSSSKDFAQYKAILSRVAGTANTLSRKLEQRDRLERQLESANKSIEIAREALTKAETNLAKWDKGESVDAAWEIEDDDEEED